MYLLVATVLLTSFSTSKFGSQLFYYKYLLYTSTIYLDETLLTDYTLDSTGDKNYYILLLVF